VFLSLGITRPINHIITGLIEGAEQVTSASGQVSAASQSLAEGATEQAAGLEETSSSLEEMSSMTKQNADNAQQANALASEAKKSAGTGAESMSRMNQAILDIQKSSDETAKIIKVIDEIAFQTNLLALNAAVEAARAGEAGKGFAVVAEEVRNLAMRSAEAAKNTARMIEESVKNSKNGVDIATEVGKVLAEIVQSVGKTTDLVSEIAAASQEQAQGIDQVNTAVAQMDKVTQQNAANAEESASASEELSAQAESMKEVVGQLVALVGGAASKMVQAGQTKTDRHVIHANPEHLSPMVRKAESKAYGFGKSDEAFHKIARPPDRRHPAANAASKTIPLDNNEHSLEGFGN
jgi:methyl-accepting chemotaxis protein